MDRNDKVPGLTRTPAAPGAAPHPAGGEPASAAPKPPPKPGVWDRLAARGRSFVSDTVARLLGPAEPPPAPPPDPDGSAAADLPNAAATPGSRRVGVLHSVTERLRGAADTFVSAKLDEIEARVDTKLEEIERLIDRKLTAFHVQLQEMRDKELRHRLRLLRVTLIFTVVVALLSLGYKFIDKFWLH